MFVARRQSQSDTEAALRAYFSAKAAVVAAGFSAEIDYHAQLNFDAIQERDFLREAAWVILSSGMRESVIAQKFPGISDAFLNWTSSEEIVAEKACCRTAALAVFRHVPKVEAILEVASIVAIEGFEAVRRNVEKYGPHHLERFGFIGPTTSLHLAKNLGLDFVKPDRHLVRIASALGYKTADELCQEVARELGERACIVDVVFWRFATLNSDYIASLTGFVRL
ncbi:MAG: hypothetical protein LC776_04655 [Acidobacteria bacterium]|nr:hypothetical protein [Acidobacteriota bacterium]